MKDDNSDNAILSWQHSCLVNNVMTIAEPQSHSKPSSSSNPKKWVAPLKELKRKTPSFEEEWEDAMFSSNAPIKSYVSKDVYKEMNLGTEEVSKIIKVHEKLSKIQWQYWYNFFTRNIKVFTWTYKDLRGILPWYILFLSPYSLLFHKAIFTKEKLPPSHIRQCSISSSEDSWNHAIAFLRLLYELLAYSIVYTYWFLLVKSKNNMFPT